MRMTYRFLLTPIFALSLVLLGQSFARADSIGPRSCDGFEACTDNTGRIGNDSCNADYACTFNDGRIRNYSCNGYLACCGNPEDIGQGQCNGDYACWDPSNCD